MTNEMKAARTRLADKTIAAMEKAAARGQWKAHAKHLDRLGQLLAE